MLAPRSKERRFAASWSDDRPAGAAAGVSAATLADGPAPEVYRLDAASAPAFESLTFAYLRPTLRRMPDDVLALGAAAGGDARGLLLGRAAGAGPWEVLSICAAAPWRGGGVATALMERFAREAAAARASGIAIGYTVQRSTPALERVLRKTGFGPPATEALVYTLDERVGGAPWLRLGRVPPPLSVTPWVELDGQALAEVRSGRGTAYPAYLDPLAGGQRTDPLCSLALMEGRRVAGWCIALAAAPDTLLYASLFVREDLRGAGCAAGLLAEAVRRHLARGVPRGLFAVRCDNAGMSRLAQRWLAPYAARTTERRTAVRPLGPAATIPAREGAEV